MRTDANECSGSRHCYTAGSWGVEQTSTTNWIGPLRKDGKVNEIVAKTDREGLKPEALSKNDANALLISAAPDLLEAVEAMLEEYEDGRNIQPFEIREMCRQAKYKATTPTHVPEKTGENQPH